MGVGFEMVQYRVIALVEVISIVAEVYEAFFEFASLTFCSLCFGQKETKDLPFRRFANQFVRLRSIQKRMEEYDVEREGCFHGYLQSLLEAQQLQEVLYSPAKKLGSWFPPEFLEIARKMLRKR